MTTPTDWRAECRARSRQHRWRSATLNLRRPDGQPLAGTWLTARLVRNPFLVGTCLAPQVLEQGPTGEAYRGFVRRHFQATVCENAMKWYATEPQRDQVGYANADRKLAWSESHGLPMRGHCLFWDKQKFAQPWVQELAPDDLRRRVFARIAEIIGRYRGRLIAWDVNNELLDGGFFGGRLGPSIHADIFKAAHDANPGCPLYVNEYAILDQDEKLERYLRLIDDLRQRGAPVGGIGIQEHAVERFAPDLKVAADEVERPERTGRGPLVPEDVWRRLDRLAALGLPIHITEVSSKTDDDVRRADTLEMMLRTAHAHPAVGAILLWGFWAKAHWLGRPAALADEAWTPLPAAHRLAGLLDEWTTEVSVQTDAEGRVTLEGWAGDYHLGTAGLSGSFRLGSTAQATVALTPA